MWNVRADIKDQVDGLLICLFFTFYASFNQRAEIGESNSI